MSFQQQTSAEYFKSLKILFYALIVTQLMTAFAIIVARRTADTASSLSDLSGLFVYIIPAAVIAGFVVSYLVYSSRIKLLITNDDLKVKMTDYRNAMIIRLALLEAKM